MKDYKIYLEWIASPMVLAEKILSDEFGYDEFFYVFTQNFDLNNKIPFLARAIYKASIIGSFNDRFLSRDLLKPFFKSKQICESKYSYHQTLNIFYIIPEIFFGKSDEVINVIASLKGSNLFWLFSNPDSFTYTENLLDNYLRRMSSVEHKSSATVLQIVLDQARAVYGPKSAKQELRKLDFDEGLITYTPFLHSEFNSNQLELANVKAPAKMLLKKPKVAICITGQFRAFKQAIDSWAEFLQPDADYDFYISTWDIAGYKKFSWAHLERMCDKEAADYLRQLKELPNQIDSFDKYCEDFFHNVGAIKLSKEQIASQLSRYGTLIKVNFFSEIDEKFISMSNAEKMYFHNMIAFESLVHSGKQYDAIVKIRPDSLVGYRRFPKFWNRLSIDLLSSRKIYAETSYRFEEWGFGCGDQIAIGTHETMQRYCSVYERRDFHKSYQRYVCENLSEAFQGHASVAIDLWVSGTDVAVVPLELRGLANEKKYNLIEIKPLIEDIRLAIAGS
jgi:hypothetical protein